jgi:hypothetical protein
MYVPLQAQAGPSIAKSYGKGSIEKGKEGSSTKVTLAKGQDLHQQAAGIDVAHPECVGIVPSIELLAAYNEPATVSLPQFRDRTQVCIEPVFERYLRACICPGAP